MIGSGMSSSANTFAAQHVHVVALYDAVSGEIKHLHTVTTVGNGTPLTQTEAVAQAKSYAARRRLNVDQLEVALSEDANHGLTPHQIDPATRAFTPMTAPSKPGTEPG